MKPSKMLWLCCLSLLLGDCWSRDVYNFLPQDEEDRSVLILIAVESNAEFEGAIQELKALTYPKDLLSVGISIAGEDVSVDEQALDDEDYAAVMIVKQSSNRSFDKIRNTLLISCLTDETYVLWLDFPNIHTIPHDIIQQLISTEKDCIEPKFVDTSGQMLELSSKMSILSPTEIALQSNHRGVPELRYRFVNHLSAHVLLLKASIHRDGLLFSAAQDPNLAHRVYEIGIRCVSVSSITVIVLKESEYKVNTPEPCKILPKRQMSDKYRRKLQDLTTGTARTAAEAEALGEILHVVFQQEQQDRKLTPLKPPTAPQINGRWRRN